MANFVVTTLADVVNAGDGVTSLREALTLAQGSAGADTITFAAGLAGGNNAGVNDGHLVLTQGELVVDSDVTILGDVVGNDHVPDITVNANQLSTVFNVAAGTSTLDSLVITGGRYIYGGYSNGYVPISLGSGVRIASGASVAIAHSTITGNQGNRGGGIYNVGTATLTDSVVSDNSTYGKSGGGGIANRGTVTLTNTTVSHNSAVSGGGLYNQHGGSAALVNSTLWGNSASRGGGIYNYATVTLTNTTVTANSASGSKGGGRGAGVYSYGTATLTNSIVACNFTGGYSGKKGGKGGQSGLGQDFEQYGSTTFVGLNIIGIGGDADASDHVINTATLSALFAALTTVDPDGTPGTGDEFQIALLANNGGPVPTVAILRGGLAHDPSGTTTPTDTTDVDGDLNTSEALPVDARGFVRLVGGSVDIGAFELQANEGFPPPVPPPSSEPSSGRDELFGEEGANTIAALAGDDVVWGLGGGDLMLGNEGADTVHAGQGNNTVFGGKENDLIDAGDGNDLLLGNEGFDSIDGGEGNNTIVGGNDSADGADTIAAGGGADLIWGNGGNDFIASGGGADTVVGGFGTDSLVTGGGDDVVFGNQGNDCIVAGDGADLVFGGQGDDAIGAGAGNDTVFGNEGNDTIAGGAGADRLVFATGAGADQVDGFSFAEGDRLDLQGQTFTLGTSADGDVVLILAGGGTIELNGVVPAAFSPTFIV